jgi:hypothetical protein
MIFYFIYFLLIFLTNTEKTLNFEHLIFRISWYLKLNILISIDKFVSFIINIKTEIVIRGRNLKV